MPVIYHRNVALLLHRRRRPAGVLVELPGLVHVLEHAPRFEDGDADIAPQCKALEVVRPLGCPEEAMSFSPWWVWGAWQARPWLGRARRAWTAQRGVRCWPPRACHGHCRYRPLRSPLVRVTAADELHLHLFWLYGTRLGRSCADVLSLVPLNADFRRSLVGTI
jgi:hypothetical protein